MGASSSGALLIVSAGLPGPEAEGMGAASILVAVKSSSTSIENISAKENHLTILLQRTYRLNHPNRLDHPRLDLVHLLDLDLV
jgi:hypothetical protein